MTAMEKLFEEIRATAPADWSDARCRCAAARAIDFAGGPSASLREHAIATSGMGPTEEDSFLWAADGSVPSYPREIARGIARDWCRLARRLLSMR